MKTLIAIVYSLWFLIFEGGIQVAHSYEQSDFNKLLKSKECVNCDLGGARLKGAKLKEASLEGAYLYKSNFEGAYLKGTINLTLKQLSKVRTLYKAKLRSKAAKKIKKSHPHLLEKPKVEKIEPQ